MRWLDRLEARLQWLAFPGLFKYLIFIGVVLFAWQWVDPEVPARIQFDRDKILAGEVWRVVSFVFAPMGVYPFGPWGVFFLYFAVRIAFLVSDSLEDVLGPLRLTLYLLVGWFGMAVAQFLLPAGPMPAGLSLYTSLFLAFATHFPRYEFRIFFVLPVQVRYLAMITGVFVLLSVLGSPRMLVVVIPALLPYLIWVFPTLLRGQVHYAKAVKRRQKFTLAKRPAGEAFHRCTRCQRTEHDDPDLEFRTFPDGTEYCLEHLPEQAPN